MGDISVNFSALLPAIIVAVLRNGLPSFRCKSGGVVRERLASAGACVPSAVIAAALCANGLRPPGLPSLPLL